MSNREHLSNLLNKIKIEDTKLTFVSARKPEESVSISFDSLEKELNSEKLLNDLQKIVYTQYNACNEDEKLTPKPNLFPFWMPSLEQQRIQNDNFWDLESEEAGNTVIARKHSERARIPDGNYYKVGVIKLGIQKGKKTKKINAVHIVTSRQTIQSDKKDENFSFITIYGNYILKDESGEDTIRFYFNLIPKRGAIRKWKERLLRRLNDRAIPFNLKYLSQLQDYNRSDAGVLYIQKHNFNLVAPIILEVYQDLVRRRAIRTSSVPLFTREIKGGLGFAESPTKREISFGMSVSTTISEGLISFLKSNTNIDKNNLETCVNHIEALFTTDPIRNNKRNFDEIYMNQGSVVSYDFSLFDKEVPTYKPFPGKARFLRAASHFANILKEKALNLSGERTWITYDEIIVPSTMGKSLEKGFRLVDDLERQGIEFFLSNFESLTSNGEPSKVPVPDGLEWSGSALDWNDITLNKAIPNDFEQGTKLEADKLIQKYINIRFPLPNGFSTFEFCPTLTHGLACIGYFFLYVHCKANENKSHALRDFPSLSQLISEKK